MFRSKMFSLSTVTYFGCNLTYSQANQWLLSRIDIQETIDLTMNPSSTTSELVMQSNSLAYGTYIFSFQVNLIVPSMSSGVTFTAMISTYVQIIPTGLVVFALRNGIANILIGYAQSQSLNPTEYSFDFDEQVSIKSLDFRFYCVSLFNYQTVPLSMSSIDLATYKNNPSLSMNSSQTCFSSNGMHN